MFNLTDVLVEDTSVPLDALPKPPRAGYRDRGICRLQRSGPAGAGLPAPAEAFWRARDPCDPNRPQGRGRDGPVQVRLRQGVDESTAFGLCHLHPGRMVEDDKYALCASYPHGLCQG